MQRQEEAQLRVGALTTLDEPIYETIMRDVRQISDKLKVVLLPLGQENDDNVLKRLRECELPGWMCYIMLLVIYISLSFF